MENIPEITRINFKQLRRDAGISVKQLTKKAGVVESTILNFENGSEGKYTNINTKEYNVQKIVDALKYYLEHPDEIDVAYKEPKCKYGKDVIDILRKYCKINYIGVYEFCNMCDIGHSTLSTFRNGIGMGNLKKICDACGFTVEDIISGKILEEGHKMSYVGTEKSMRALGLLNEEKKEEPINDIKPAAVDYNNNVRLRRVTTPTDERRNVQYVAKNGHYFCEYEVVKQVSDIITKEEFMAAINNMEG